MRNNYKTFVALLIYVVSVGALTLSDLVVIKFFDETQVADWAFYKSFIFVCGGMCVLGFDQLLLREIDKYDFFKLQFIVQSLIMSLIISSLLFFYNSDLLSSIQSFIILFLFSNFMFQAGYYRAIKNLIKAQINTNLWKFILLLFLIISINFNNNNILLIYSSAFILTFVFLIIINRKNKALTKEEKTLNLDQGDRLRYLLLGLYFFLHSFSLVIANYGEQFIINIFNEDLISSQIFSYITLYSSIVLASIGFIGFYLGPKIRYKENFKSSDYKKYQKLMLISSIIFISINSTIAYIIYPYFFQHLGFDFTLWILIIALTFCRVFYTLPSLCLGVYGSENDLKKTSLYSLLAVILYISFFALLMRLDITNKAYYVVCLMITHWLTKIFISNFFTNQILNRRSLA